MEFKLTKIAISKPMSVYLMVVILMIIGTTAYLTMPKESFPEASWNHLYVSIPYPGASSLDIERQITNKVEKNLKYIDSLVELRSTSENAIASIDLKFLEGFDKVKAKSDIRDALEKVKPDLPKDGNEWVISDFNMADEPILTVNISGDIAPYQLKKVAEDLKDLFSNIPNVSEVTRIGGLEKEIQVLVNPEKLSYYGIDLNQLSQTIANENKNIPAGTLKAGQSELMVRIPGEIKTEREIAQMIITYANGAPVYVRDVASVHFSFQDPENRARLDGKDSISLEVKKRKKTDMGAIAKRVKEILKEEQTRFGSSVRLAVLGDQSVDVDTSVRDLENNIYTGIMFVFLVLLVFLGFRNALFVGTAIPLSMLLSFAVLKWMGITLNQIVLFSLIVSLGMLVDNAIVVVENIYRHMQTGKSKVQAAIDGVSEVVAPVFASTLTTLLAFFPIIFMPNMIGDIFSYLPKTLLVTLTSSLIVGLIINPVFCSTFMAKPKHKGGLDEIKQVEQSRFLMKYKRILDLSLRFPIVTILAILVFWIGTASWYFTFSNPEMKVEFFPTSEATSAEIVIDTPDGVSLAYADEIVREVEDHVFKYRPYVDSILTNVNKNASSVVLNFPTWKEWKDKRPSQIIEELRGITSNYSGANIRVVTSEGLSAGKEIQIEVLGEDLNRIKYYTTEIAKAIQSIDDLVNLENSMDSKRSEINIQIDKEKIARHGLTTSDVSSILRIGLQGSDVSDYQIGKDDFDIIVKLDKKFLRYEGDIDKLQIRTPGGESIQLSELATISKVQSKGTIYHIDRKRLGTIQADTGSRRSGSEVLKEAQERIQPIIKRIVAEGMKVQYAGADELESESQNFLVKSFGIAILLIFVVLVTQFNSFMLPFIVLTSVFASFSGIFLGYSIHGINLSVMVGGIGVIALAGIVVNNGIVLLDYIQQLRNRGFEIKEAILLSGMVRLRPVLLTAITTMLGMLPITIGMEINFYQWPFVIFGSESGTMWKPLNIAVVYGIGVATFLTLFLVPTLYYLNENIKNQIIASWQKIQSFQTKNIKEFFHKIIKKNHR